MATISKPFTFSAGAVIVASEHNSNFDTIYNDYNGNITNVNLAASAAIVDTKLAQITANDKVSISALVVSSEAQGDILYFNGTDWTRLGAGTSGNVLKTQGAAANPAWDTVGSAAGGTPALTLGTANAAGSAGTVVRTDATILAFDTTVPVALGTAAAGSATVAARRDHVHPQSVDAIDIIQATPVTIANDTAYDTIQTFTIPSGGGGLLHLVIFMEKDVGSGAGNITISVTDGAAAEVSINVMYNTATSAVLGTGAPFASGFQQGALDHTIYLFANLTSSSGTYTLRIKSDVAITGGSTTAVCIGGWSR